MPTGEFDRDAEAAAWIRAELGDPPETAVVLGSGLGGVASQLADSASRAYADIPHWPVARVVGHAGRLVAGRAGGRRVLALAGRVHGYEGHDPARVAFPIRVLGHLGVKQMILTNAAGGISPHLRQGVLMVIDDHINLTGGNPLRGPNDDRFGPRFPDMSEVYSKRLRALTDKAARERSVPLTHGVYLAVAGPSYETPAEIRAFRALGADAVGMSTVHEAIVARHMGLEVLGLSCISNLAAGLTPKTITSDEVIETTGQVVHHVLALLEGLLVRL